MLRSQNLSRIRGVDNDAGQAVAVKPDRDGQPHQTATKDDNISLLHFLGLSMQRSNAKWPCAA
jgi:hypothetical protein